MTLEEKSAALRALLQEYATVAVAFSGGVDSPFLLRSALDVPGAGTALALHARTCLTPIDERRQALDWPDRHGLAGVSVREVELQPLAWKEFVKNTEKRCYHCKRRMYTEFLEIIHAADIAWLLDGTNTDDLRDRRPGLQAIHELGVKTPLVRAGLDKHEIRQLSRNLGLDTWDRPSASCLATRIPHGLEITSERLACIASFEEMMQQLGFTGCRVRLHPLDENGVCLQLRQDDFDRFALAGMRQAIIRSFRKEGIGTVYLDLNGR